MFNNAMVTGCTVFQGIGQLLPLEHCIKQECNVGSQKTVSVI